MSKTLRNKKRAERERYRRIKGVQDVIPIQSVTDDGIFCVSSGMYSKTWGITDINYAVASREDKEALFLEYTELLNSFDSAATTKLTVALRHLNASDFKRRILIPYKEDGLDIYRREYNKMLMDKATGASSMIREVYLTVSVKRKDIADAKGYFRRTATEMSTHLTRLGSKLIELDTEERLKLLHSFYREGEDAHFFYDAADSAKKGHSFKDAIAPDSFEFKSDHFKMGEKYGRVLYLREYASYLKDSFLSELTDMKHALMLSIDIIPIPTDEAVREVEKRLLGVEVNITNWTRRQNANQNYNVIVPYDMEQQRKESREFLDDLVTRDQRMMVAVVTLVHTADTKEALDSDTEAIKTCARKHLCSMTTLKFQQADGLNTALPIGDRTVKPVSNSDKHISRLVVFFL